MPLLLSVWGRWWGPNRTNLGTDRQTDIHPGVGQELIDAIIAELEVAEELWGKLRCRRELGCEIRAGWGSSRRRVVLPSGTSIAKNTNGPGKYPQPPSCCLQGGQDGVSIPSALYPTHAGVGLRDITASILQDGDWNGAGKINPNQLLIEHLLSVFSLPTAMLHLLALHPRLCSPAPFPNQVHAGSSLLLTHTQSKSRLEEQQPPWTIPC